MIFISNFEEGFVQHRVRPLGKLLDSNIFEFIFLSMAEWIFSVRVKVIALRKRWKQIMDFYKGGIYPTPV
jgi:hypothetical protein